MMEAVADKLEAEGERFNPFPGLRPFQPDEDHLFFGRESETDELLRRLRTHRFVSVLGTSGSGKSSLVRSGLIPSLYSGFMVKAGSDWRVAVFRPGDNPIGNLARALDAPDVLGGSESEMGGANRMLLESTLRRSSLGLADSVRYARLGKGENVLVVVDQFEELFRFRESHMEHGSRDDAVAFAKLLLGAAHQQEAAVYVVITMRSDFIGDCMDYPGLPEAINRGQYLIPRMTRDELRQAMTGPVAVGGGEIAPRLVTRLLNELGDDPDQLPVLQHALMRTWDHWARDGTEREPLDLGHYEAIGTMKEALSQHAEEAFDELDGARPREIAERLFKALTDKGKDGRGVRRPTPVHDVAEIAGADDAEVIEVVEVFRRTGRSFLMPPAGVDLVGESTLDLSHESLMRNWRRLVEWVEEETSSGKSYRRLSRAARRFERGEGSLWVEPELSLGLDWREKTKPTRAWAQRYDTSFERAVRFLEESEEERDRTLRTEEEARRAKLRGARILSVILGSAAAITLVFGLYAVRAGRIARQAEQVATAQAETARAVSSFLVSLFEVADPEEARGNTITAQEILDEGARKIDTELAGQPEVQARMMATIGKVYGSLGLYDEARPLLERARDTAEEVLGANHPDTLAVLHRLAEARWNQGQYKEAEQLYLQVLEGRRDQLGEDHTDTLATLTGLGQVYESMGRHKEAEATARQALETKRRVLGAEHQETLESMQLLASALMRQGRYPEAETLFSDAWERQRATLGDEHPDTITTMGSLGALFTDLGRFDEAEKLYTANLESRRRVFGDEHPKTLVALQRLGMLDLRRGRWRAAEKRFNDVLEARRRVLGGDHPSTILTKGRLAWLYHLQARYEEAGVLAEGAFEAARRVLGEEDPATRGIANILATVYSDRGQYDKAEKLYKENLEIYQRLYGEAHPQVFTARNNLAVIYAQWGRVDRSDELTRENFEVARQLFGEDHPQTLFYMNNMVVGHNQQRRFDEAVKMGEESLERHRRILGNDNPQTLYAMGTLVDTYNNQKRIEDAEKLTLEWIEGFRRLFGDDHPETLNALWGASWFYQNLGRNEEALTLRRQVLEGRRRVFGDEHPSTIGAYGALAWLYQTMNQPKQALDLRTRAMEIRRRMAIGDDAGPSDKQRYAEALISAQRELQNPEEAVRVALQANEMTGYENRNYVATLAEAYFRAGQTAKAIETQKRAIDLIPEDDPESRTGFESRLAEFYEATGDVTAKRQAQADEIARKKEAAEKPDASPRARNNYAWELLIADPPDLQDPTEALRVALAVNESTGYEDANLLNTLALAYHRTNEVEKAVETQQKVVSLTPEDEVWNAENQKLRLRVYRGEGSREFDPTRALPGVWSGTIGPLQSRVEFRRDGDYVLGINRLELPWTPEGEIMYRFHVETGDMELQIADDGWTNTRFEPGDYRMTDAGELITWQSKQWYCVRWQKE